MYSVCNKYGCHSEIVNTLHLNISDIIVCPLAIQNDRLKVTFFWCVYVHALTNTEYLASIAGLLFCCIIELTLLTSLYLPIFLY